MRSKLEHGLVRWVDAGIISAGQADLIRKHEASRAEVSWVLTGALILGAVVVGIGVISLIAANWEAIPSSVKILVDFLLLGGTAFGIDRCWVKGRPVLYETLIVAMMMLVLASIGLISQIFHTGGALAHALLFWSAITLPLVLCAQRMFVPMMWTGVFIGAGFATLAMNLSFQSWMNQAPGAVGLLFPLLSVCFWLTLVMMGRATKLAVGFGAWAFLMSLAVILLADSGVVRHRQVDWGHPGLVFSWTLAGLAMIATFGPPTWNRLQRTCVAMTIGTFALVTTLATLKVTNHFAAALGTVLYMAVFAASCASFGRRQLFQMVLVLVGIRFLVLYFQALGGLAFTGFGLILSGAVVMAVAMIWHKNRHMIADWAERRLR